MTTVQDYYKEMAERRDQNRASLLEELRLLKVIQVTAIYSGAGDSGQLEAIETTPGLPKGHMVQGCSGLQPIRHALEGLFYDCLEIQHGGWENNAGGDGEIHWDIATDKIRIEHNQFFESSDYSETEL